jgi:hypothetical protein
MSAVADNWRGEGNCFDCKHKVPVDTPQHHKVLLLCTDCATRRSTLKAVKTPPRVEPPPPLSETRNEERGTRDKDRAEGEERLEVPVLREEEEPEVEQLLKLHAKAPLVSRPLVSLPPLPEGSSDAMRRVADLYALVRGVREWAGDDRPVPFACGWVAEKTGLPKPTVHRALRLLVDAEVLDLVGAMPGRGARGTHLYGPGGAS